MFSINTGQTAWECGNLEAQARTMLEQMQETERAVQNLSLLSGMEEPIARLEKQLGDMREEYHVLRQMLHGLNKISLYYIKCENRICDDGEQSTIRFARQEVGVNDLSDIADLLENI